MTLRTSGRIFVLAVGLLGAGRTPVVDAPSNTVVSTENSDSGVRVAKPETTPDLPRWNPKKPILGARINPYSVLSAGVYAASWTDMLKTESSLPNFREDDPLARPFVALPRPLYFASASLMATGVNWAAWKMKESPRWHKIWWLPQAVSIAANMSGYGYTCSNTNGPVVRSSAFKMKPR